MGMSKKKLVSLAALGAVGFSLTSPFIGAQTALAQEADWNSERYGDTLDVDTYLDSLSENEAFLKEAEQKVQAQAAELQFDASAAGSETAASGAFSYDGGTKYFLDYNLNFKEYTLRSVGENVEIWVANDTSFPEGDPRPAPVVTQAQVDALRDEFDSNIYPQATAFFGTPDPLDGTDALLETIGIPDDYYGGSDKILLMVDNVQDENYFNPAYPNYVAGFFWQTLEIFTGRNMITIDTHDWANRLDPGYFGTTIHELQHLIHADNDPAEETWINEGMSTFSEFLGGYGHDTGAINYYLDHPENSLVNWDDHRYAETGPETIADYGQVYLFALYMNDQFGQAFIRDLALNQKQGIDSVNEVLAQHGTKLDFTQLYQNFIAALVLDNDRHGNDAYAFDSINLRDIPVDRAGTPRGYTVDFEKAELYEKEGVPAWGGDFKELAFDSKIKNISFNGVDFLPQQWQVVADPLDENNAVFWGNQGNEVVHALVWEADLRNVESATLKFDHLLQIEEAWDYGFVQVSTDGGATWQSLANANTRSDVADGAYPSIIDSLPGFTGLSDGWQRESFDLTPYAGQSVLLSFRYLTDWASNEAGWYVDNIAIPEIGYANDGSSTSEFMSLDEVTGDYVNYTVTFINERVVGNGKGQKTNTRVIEVDPFNVTDEDALQLNQLFQEGRNYMVTTYAAPSGQKNPVEFSYEIQLKE